MGQVKALTGTQAKLRVIPLPSSGRKRHPSLEGIISKLVLFAGKRRPLEAINAVPKINWLFPVALEASLSQLPCARAASGHAAAALSSAMNSRPSFDHLVALPRRMLRRSW